jgi:hypothetical protein
MVDFVDEFISKVEIVELREGVWVKAICPVCHTNSLKMNLNAHTGQRGKYKCWEKNCSCEDIRKELGIQKRTRDVFSPSDIFKKTDRSQYGSRIVLDKPPQPFTGKELRRCKPGSEPLSIKLLQGSSQTRKTFYLYNQYLRVLRFDHPNQPKKVYIQNWDSGEGWVPGVGDRIWPVFCPDVEILNPTTADTVIFVEGEKAAWWLTRKGIVAHSLASHCYYGSARDSALTVFRYHNPEIKNVFYIADCDEAGRAKETIFKQGMGLADLGYQALSLNSIFPELGEFSKKDVADLTDSQYEKLLLYVNAIIGREADSHCPL